MKYPDTWYFQPRSTAYIMSPQYSNRQKQLAAIKGALKLRCWLKQL